MSVFQLQFLPRKPDFTPKVHPRSPISPRNFTSDGYIPNEGVQKLLPLLKLMSNDCDYGGEKCACNHVSVDLLMMQSLMAGMQSRGETIDLSPFMFMMWDPVPGCMGSLPNGDECICGTGGYF